MRRLSQTLLPKDSDHVRAGTFLPSLRRFARSGHGPILLGLLILLAVAVVTLTDYGSSLDEERNVHMGKVFLQAYGQGNLFRSPGIEYFNGPFYFMVFTLTSQLFHTLNPGWLLTDGLHLTNFLTFLGGVFFFHRVALRLLPRGLALFVTVLFATQPVLFGHAFINQKDTPFMAFFALTLVLGLSMAERFLGRVPNRPSDSGRTGAGPSAFGLALRAAWAEDPRRARRAAIVVAALALSVPAVGIFVHRPLRAVVEGAVRAAYRGEAWAPINQLFVRFAENAGQVPVEDYVQRANHLINLSMLAAAGLMVAAALVAVGRL